MTVVLMQNWLSLEKKFKGAGLGEDNTPLIFKTIGYCFYIVFRKFLGKTPFRGAKVV